MQTVKFVTTDKGKVYVWYTTNTLIGFRNFLQYILDSSNTPEGFYINFLQYILDSSNTPEGFYMIDVEKDLVYSAYRIATEMYYMRKRTFEERMENIQTGKWFGVDLKEIEKHFSIKK